MNGLLRFMSLHKKKRMKIHLSISFLSLTPCSIKIGIAFNKSLIQCPEKLQIGSCVTWSLIFSIHYVNLSSLLSYLFRLASFSPISQLYFSSRNHPWLIPPLFSKITIVPHPIPTPTYFSWAGLNVVRHKIIYGHNDVIFISYHPF